ncbi:MAG: dephospho-CoA kinase [Phycisphaerae bacterium]|nr:dephospho-CoA kinase [Phycisphaerae bacterium]
MKRKPIIGLAGGIGAGKSTVAAEFARLGCLVLDSDRQAHEVLQRPDVAAQVRQWLDQPNLDFSDPQVRRTIGKLIFGRPELVAKINGLIHPRVHAMRRAAVEQAAGDPAIVAVVLDTPLLFEADVATECDATVFVDAPLALRRERVAASRGWSAEELQMRQGRQMDLREKRDLCDHVIVNDGSPDELARQVRAVLESVNAECGIRNSQ